jgi:hypothetical protein
MLENPVRAIAQRSGGALEEAVMVDAGLKKLAPDAVGELHRC